VLKLEFEGTLGITAEEWRMIEQESRAYREYTITCIKEYINSLERLIKSGRTIGAEKLA